MPKIIVNVTDDQLPAVVMGLTRAQTSFTVEYDEKTPSAERTRKDNPVSQSNSGQAVLAIMKSMPDEWWDSDTIGEVLAKGSEYKSSTAGPCLSGLAREGILQKKKRGPGLRGFVYKYETQEAQS